MKKSKSVILAVLLIVSIILVAGWYGYSKFVATAPGGNTSIETGGIVCTMLVNGNPVSGEAVTPINDGSINPHFILTIKNSNGSNISDVDVDYIVDIKVNNSSMPVSSYYWKDASGNVYRDTPITGNIIRNNNNTEVQKVINVYFVNNVESVSNINAVKFVLDASEKAPQID